MAEDRRNQLVRLLLGILRRDQTGTLHQLLPRCHPDRVHAWPGLGCRRVASNDQVPETVLYIKSICGPLKAITRRVLARNPHHPAIDLGSECRSRSSCWRGIRNPSDSIRIGEESVHQTLRHRSHSFRWARRVRCRRHCRASHGADCRARTGTFGAQCSGTATLRQRWSHRIQKIRLVVAGLVHGRADRECGQGRYIWFA